ncbi:chromosome segregation protein ParM [Mixta intestinalis]|uniref:Uncharacterized protein n=1 Tax=Mixta intestinalis TaxID=1615494 RepID=A0A6P1Q7W6_9GAMM|nr:chromosome segregation protein ParM [Mixta intestinalis]QHM74058.1 hypothetical protein C7M51_04419 [Mixta intestinalis]
MEDSDTLKSVMRLSGIQKDILFVLYGFSEHQAGPVPAIWLLDILNKNRQQVVADTNFRRSCHTLVKHGLLCKFRNQKSLHLAFSLTPLGLITAGKIYKERMSTIQEEG